MPFSRIRCFHHVLHLSGALSVTWSLSTWIVLSTNLMKFHQVCHFCQIRRFAIFVNFLGPTSHVISIHSYNFVNKLGRNFVRFATFAEFAGYVCGGFWNPSSQLISTPSFKFVSRFADSWTDSLYWKNFHRLANPSKLYWHYMLSHVTARISGYISEMSPSLQHFFHSWQCLYECASICWALCSKKHSSFHRKS